MLRRGGRDTGDFGVLRAMAVAIPEETWVAGLVGETEGVDGVVSLVEGCVEAEGLWGWGVGVA